MPNLYGLRDDYAEVIYAGPIAKVLQFAVDCGHTAEIYAQGILVYPNIWLPLNLKDDQADLFVVEYTHASSESAPHTLYSSTNLYDTLVFFLSHYKECQSTVMFIKGCAQGPCLAFHYRGYLHEIIGTVTLRFLTTAISMEDDLVGPTAMSDTPAPERAYDMSDMLSTLDEIT